MLPAIEKLLVLQDRDRRIASLHQDLQRIPQDIKAARSRLQADEAAVAAATDKLRENEVAIKNLEIDVETRRTTITRLKNQQFETRKNEEFRALGHEIERYEKEVVTLEDRELELMEKAEQSRKALASAREGLAATQRLVDEEISRLEQRSQACTAQAEELAADRRALAGELDETLLFQYDRIFQKKRDVAVVPLEHGTCGGCHMKVTTGTVLAAKAEKEVVQCENCGRLLYFSD